MLKAKVTLSTLASLKVRNCSTRTGNTLKVNNRIVTKNLGLSHYIKVIAIAKLVILSSLGTPHLITLMRTQVGDHDNDRLTSGASFTLIRRSAASRSQFVA